MLDSLEEAILLIERSHTSGEIMDLKPVAEFIAGQQIRYGKDAGVFVETKNVSRSKARVFTGEKLQTDLAAKNILTIESARALVLSNSSSELVHSSINLAMDWLGDQCISKFCAAGECRHSTIAFMRLLSVLEETEQLDKMIQILSTYRDGKGGWKGFPYFFTLLTLIDIETEPATEELRYALEFVETRFNRSRIEEPYNSRRTEILSQIMDRHGLSLFSHV